MIVLNKQYSFLLGKCGGYKSTNKGSAVFSRALFLLTYQNITYTNEFYDLGYIQYLKSESVGTKIFVCLCVKITGILQKIEVA